MSTDSEIRKTPPPGVVFGNQMALIPALGSFFDRPLWVQADKMAFPDLGHIELGSWVSQGRPLFRFRVARRNYLGFLRSLLFELFHSPFYLPIYSPAAGLLIDKDDIFIGDNEGAMLTLLLPEQGTVPESVEHGFGKFCDLCLEHRRAIFRSRHLISERGQDSVLKTWSDKKIDKVIGELKTATITVKSASEYQDRIEEARRRYPEHFRE